MKKMTKRIALALSMVLFALAFTACGPNLLSGGDGGSKDTEGGIEIGRASCRERV